MLCPARPPLNGALLTNTNPTESSVITFQCDPGFSLVGTETATCNNSGLWDPDPALLECKFIKSQCLPVCCILTYRCGGIEYCCSIWWSCCYSGGTDLTGRSHSITTKRKSKGSLRIGFTCHFVYHSIYILHL